MNVVAKWKSLNTMGRLLYVAIGCVTFCVAAGIGFWLVRNSQSAPPEPAIATTTTIFLSPPTVFAREKLLNQQLSEAQALEAELKQVDQYRGDLQRDISTSSDRTLSIQVSGNGTVDPAPTTAEPDKTQNDVLDPKGATPFLDQLENRESLRDRINEALTANEFDDADLHDGRSLTRFQFSVSLRPPSPVPWAAEIEVTFTKPDTSASSINDMYGYILANAGVVMNERRAAISPLSLSASRQELEYHLRSAGYYTETDVPMGATAADDAFCLASKHTTKRCVMVSVAIPPIKNDDQKVYNTALNDLFGPISELLKPSGADQGNLTYFMGHNPRLQIWVRNHAGLSSTSAGICDATSWYGAPQTDDLKLLLSKETAQIEEARKVTKKQWLLTSDQLKQVEDPNFLFIVASTMLRFRPELEREFRLLEGGDSLSPTFRDAAERLYLRYEQNQVVAAKYRGWFNSMMTVVPLDCSKGQSVSARVNTSAKNVQPSVDAKNVSPSNQAATRSEKGPPDDAVAPEIPPSFADTFRLAKSSDSDPGSLFGHTATVLHLLPPFRSQAEEVATDVGNALRAQASAAVPHGSVGADYVKKVQQHASEYVSRASIVSYNESSSGALSRSGWLLRPDQNSEETSEWVQGDRSELLAADVLVPTVWPAINLKIRARWIDNDGKTVGAGKEKEVNYVVPLKRTAGDFISIAEMFDRDSIDPSRAAPQLASDDGETIDLCKTDVALVIRGDGIWHSPKVYLGGQVATNVAVLPDMNGIEAHFDPTRFSIRPRLKNALSVTLATADGIQNVGTVRVDGLPCPGGKK